MKTRASILLTAALLSLVISDVDAQSIQINEGLSGAWFNPETSGQGILFDIVPGEDLVFMAWFTFETSTSGAKIGPPEVRWLTAQGGINGNVAELTVFNSTGGVFNDPATVSTDPVGTASVEFSSCTEATFEFDLPDDGESGEIDLIRLAPDVFCAGLLPAE